MDAFVSNNFCIRPICLINLVDGTEKRRAGGASNQRFDGYLKVFLLLLGGGGHQCQLHKCVTDNYTGKLHHQSGWDFHMQQYSNIFQNTGALNVLSDKISFS